MLKLRSRLSVLAALISLAAAPPARADSTVVFNEIMYHPAADEANLEWVELHNQMAVDMDLSRWTVSGGIGFEFPEGTIAPGGGFVVIAINPSALAGATGYAGALGPYTGRLDNATNRLALRNNSGRLMDSVRYQDSGDWPVAPDGSGASLAKIDPDSASGPSANWTWSAQAGGTPGAPNFPEPQGSTPQLPAGLVSYWSFDEASGAALDAADGNTGTLGAGAVRVAGLIGAKAVSFNNTIDAFINVGAGTGNNFATTTGITVEALIAPTWSGASGDHDEIFRKEDGNSRVLLSFQNDGNGNGLSDPPLLPGYAGPVLSFGLNSGGAYKELDMPLDGQSGRPTLAGLKDGKAHHLAATYSSASGLKAIYVDGALAYSTSYTAGSQISSGGATSAYIGNMSGRGEPFTGVIDEVAFWSKALGAGELAAHFASVQAGSAYFSVSQEPSAAVPLAFNETDSRLAAPGAWIEIANHGAASVALKDFSIASTRAAPPYVFPAQTLAPGGFLALSESQLGFPLEPGDKLFLYPPGRASVADAVHLEDRHAGRHPDGTGAWLVPSQPTSGAANLFQLHDEIAINEILYHHRPEPAVPPVIEETVIVPMTAAWKYDASGNNLGTAWSQSNFNDGGWASGPALLYNETAALPAPKSTPLTLGPTTFYFRAAFQFQGDPAAANLALRLVIDDGAVFYLNGAEVFRFNMPSGEVNSSTLASPSVGDAVLSGPIPIPSSKLIAGANLLAVEVHQASPGSSDVVFGAELIGTAVLEPGKPFRDSPESWIELYNRGDRAVDMTGWRLDRGVDHLFAPGTILNPGEYLVVAADQDYLKGLYPEIPIAGNFTGRLSHRDDRIVLLDDRGNPADEVRYFDGGRWPDYADGGGSSLELRDPRADNTRAEAWAASDETGKSAWQSLSYRAIAAPNVGPTRWNEFVLGLLDAGEALIDDLSVVESPGGAAVEFLQNGTFDAGAAAWRLLGNHGQSRVEDDPDSPGNKVLHLTATGSTEHMHNHAETTFAGGRTVTNGREYEISFRARWLAGSNQLHTRLYFNRAPRTTLLDIPERIGTPGARNSRYESNIGPTFSGFGHAPVAPAAGESVTVSVEADDPDGVASVTLWRSVNGGAWASAAMAAAGGGRYTGSIPGQAASSTVQFYVEAADGRGAVAAFPAAGRDSRALYRVNDGQARLGQLHNVRIIMTAADANFLHVETNVMSNALMGATVVYDEKEAFYDLGVRLKGSERGRPVSGRVSFNLRFPPDRLFRGIHRSVSIDRAGGWRFGGPNFQDEILMKHVIQQAGGLPGMYDDLCRVIAPRAAETSSALLMMAKYGDVFLDSQYLNGSDGSEFKLELIYYPTTTTTGGPESLKRPQPDEVIGTDLRDLGDDKEAYRWNFIIENNQERDDYGRIIQFLKTMSLSGSALQAAVEDIMDVDEVTRIFAVYSMCGIGDTYLFGLEHNNIYYVRPEDQRVLAFAWDADFAFVRAVNGSYYDGGNLAKVFQLPPYQRLFLGHLRDIIQSTYNTSYMSRWTSHYGALVNQTSNFSSILTYIGQRGAYLLSTLPAQVPFAITTNGGQDFTVNAATTTIEGTAWIDVRSISISGYTGLLEFSWPSASGWRVNVNLDGGANELALTAFDFSGNLLASDTITVTSTSGWPRPAISSIAPPAARPGASLAIAGTEFHTGLQVFFGGVPAASVSFDETANPDQLTAVVPALSPGEVAVTVQNIDNRSSAPRSFTVLPAFPVFVRGDANGDSVLDLSDAVRILLHLFKGAALRCGDAADADNDEAIDVTDAVYLLTHLFVRGPAPKAPYPAPGIDPDGSGPLGCEN